MYVIEAGRPVRLEIPEDAEFGGFFKNQMLVRLRCDWTTGSRTCKQGSLISIDYDRYLKGDRAFTTIVEPNERSNVISFANTRNLLLVAMLNNVRTELYRYRFKEGLWEREKIDTPRLGTASIAAADEQTDEHFFEYEDFLTPSSLYYVSDAQSTQEVKSLPEFFNSKGLEVKQLEAVSRDGTRIPYFLVQLAGASWMAEYGNPDVPEEWAYIKRYSPYQNVSADKKYPQVLFCTSTRDDRVHPGHARKMAARMEEMGHKVYYYENTEGGHAAAATNRQRAMRYALVYSFLWMQLQ